MRSKLEGEARITGDWTSLKQAQCGLEGEKQRLIEFRGQVNIGLIELETAKKIASVIFNPCHAVVARNRYNQSYYQARKNQAFKGDHAKE